MNAPSPENERRLQHVAAWHAEQSREDVEILLENIPACGGHVSREQLVELISEAFMGGVVAQLTNPVVE